MHRRPQGKSVLSTEPPSPNPLATRSNTALDENVQTGEGVTNPRLPGRKRRVKVSKNASIFETAKDDPLVFFFMTCAAVLLILIVVGLGIVVKLLQERFWPKLSVARAILERENQKNGFEALEESKLYRIPHSMSHVGDKSDKYALLRKDYDERFPYEPERSLRFTEQLLRQEFQAVPNPDYDVNNCPKDPPEGYPYQWKTLHVLENWSPNDPHSPPSEIHQGLCVFDYRRDYLKALNYRKREVPFVVRGDPEVAQAVERWNQPDYMSAMVGGVQHRCEYSDSNQFMYWLSRKKDKPPPDWKKPTTMMRMTYEEWLKRANITDASLLGPDKPHYYYRLIGCGEIGQHGECDSGSSEYLFDELTFFQPRSSLYIVEPHQQRGIHCRFGMNGVTAENHFDGSRNSIVVLGGARRYILSHPGQCPNLYLYPKGHPSARHSSVDWNDPDLEAYPDFRNAMSNEVVLQAGDVLYLPQQWFHFIVSLSLNFQCNTRSGKSPDYDEPIRMCGF